MKTNYIIPTSNAFGPIDDILISFAQNNGVTLYTEAMEMDIRRMHFPNGLIIQIHYPDLQPPHKTTVGYSYGNVQTHQEIKTDRMGLYEVLENIIK